MPNQPPLNLDALHQLFAVAMMEVLDAEKLQPGNRLAHVNDIQEALNRLEKNILAAAQPVVNRVEELDALPQETVIRDSEDFVFERIVQHGKDTEWWCTTDFLNETKVTLPARVLYRPAVDDA